MRRTCTPWLLALPLMAGGSLAAHVVGYRLATPDAHNRARGLQLSGHSYLDQLPLILALISAPAMVALALAAFGRARGQSRALAAWTFALLPPLSFVLQEHLERFVHSGAFPWGASLERSFVLGLVLQAPFALLAFLLARGLLAGMHALQHALRRPPRIRRRARRHRFVRHQVCLQRPATLALGHAERGPPLLTRI